MLNTLIHKIKIVGYPLGQSRCISGKKPLLILLTSHFSLLTCVCFAQQINNPDIKRTYHWYFGNGAGIDFSSGIAVADTNGNLHTYEGCAVMSDTAGNLLFYTDGDTVWNKNHLPMLNGTGLMGCGNYGSSAQAALIVPHPGNDSIYYICTSDCWENSGANGYRYSIVNIKLNGGLGDVISKNNLLYAPSTEGLTATMHCNNNAYWIATHKYATDEFYLFELTPSGLNTVPVISSIGLPNTDYQTYLKFSHDGKKLAALIPNSIGAGMLLDFDNNSGTLCNNIYLTGIGDYSPEFSPDDSKLYFMSSGSYIYQYDLTVGNDSLLINSSGNIVGYNPDNSTYGGLNTAADNKIYVSSLSRDSLSTISNPNIYGPGCGFLDFTFSLLGKYPALGIPNFVTTYFGDTIICKSCITAVSEINSEQDIISVYPNPTNGVLFCYSKEKIHSIKLYTIQGVKIGKQSVSNHENIYIFDLSQEAKGVYLLQVQTSNEIISKKILLTN